MKKIALFAMAAITFAACSNEDDVLNTGMTESQFRENEVILVPEVPGGTRNAVTPDLVNVWEVGDTVGASVVCGSTTIENGVFIAKEFTIHERTLIGFQSDGTVDWQDGSSNHNFYIYYPYVAGATHTAVPVTLNSVQTKAVPNLFLWAASTNLKKPADNAVPFAAKRLLPVAEFNIIRDDETLDGYTLDNIVVKPTDGSTMATGTTNVNLETLGNATSVSFSGTATQYQLNYAVAVSTIGMDDSKSVYMSLPPAAAKEYTITATFKKGSDTKTIAVTRTNAFTIAYGKGNFVRYYFKSSEAEAAGYTITYDANYDGGSTLTATKIKDVAYTIASNTFTAPDGQAFSSWNTASDGSGTSYAPGDSYSDNANLTLYAQWVAAKTNLNPTYSLANFYQWDAYRYYDSSTSSKNWGPGQPYGNYNAPIAEHAASASCKDCPTITQMQMYLGAGVLYDNGAAGANQQSYSTPTGMYHDGVWLKKKAYIPGFDAGTATKSAGAVPPTMGRPEASVINQYFFLPLCGRYAMSAGYSRSDGDCYWLSTKQVTGRAPAVYISSAGVMIDTDASVMMVGLVPMVLE